MSHTAQCSVQEQSTKTKTSITHEQSQKLIQTMLTMSFGCVAFLRGLFPDDSFVDQRFVPNKFESDYDPNDPKNKNDSIRVKTLVRGKSSQADLFLDWIDKGATDAIRKGYLKSLSFAVFLDEKQPNDLHEVYTFFFDYKNEGVQFSINDQESEAISLLDSRKMLQQLMKRFIIITQSLEPLPEHKYMSMRMLFNESCPKDYQPPFFMDASSEPSALLKAPRDSTIEKHSAGTLNTSFHNIQLKVLSRPVLIAEDDEVVEIDPFNTTPFKAPALLKPNLPPKNTSRFVKREPSQTTNMLRDYLKSSQPEIKLTQAIKRISCECGSNDETDVSGIIRCSSCDGMLHGSCYAYNSRRQATTCFTCRSASLGGIKKHENLSILMIARKLYRLVTRDGIPISTGLMHNQLGFKTNEKVSITTSVVSFFFKKGIFLLEHEPRALKGNNHAKGRRFQKHSSYVDVDMDGILVNGKQLSKGRYTWSFVAQVHGNGLQTLKSSAARAKRFLFEDTIECGLAIDVCIYLLNAFYLLLIVDRIFLINLTSERSQLMKRKF